MVAYTRAQVKQIIRQRTDMENTTFETETELEGHINDAAAVLHDLLISCANGHYAYASASFPTIIGTADYQIADSAAVDIDNVYKLIRVSIPFDGFDYPLLTYEPEGIVTRNVKNSWGPGNLPKFFAKIDHESSWVLSFDPPPDSVNTINIAYHTPPPVYLSDSDVVSIPYSDYLIIEACIRIKDKEERDSTRLERERSWIQKRIEDWGATFDRSNPTGTIDVYRRRRLFEKAF